LHRVCLMLALGVPESLGQGCLQVCGDYWSIRVSGASTCSGKVWCRQGVGPRRVEIWCEAHGRAVGLRPRWTTNVVANGGTFVSRFSAGKTRLKDCREDGERAQRIKAQADLPIA